VEKWVLPERREMRMLLSWHGPAFGSQRERN